MSVRVSATWRERLTSPLTWHYAGVGVMLVLVVGLGIRFGLDWAATNGSSADALAGKQVELKALDLQTAPLRGLDKRVDDSRAQCGPFTTSAFRRTTPRSPSASASWRWSRVCGSRGCSTRRARPALI